MSDCIDKRLGNRLYAYEIGLLADDEREEFEIHLLECKHCNDRAQRFISAAEIIRRDGQFQETVAGLDRQRPTAGKRRITFLRAAAMIAAVLVILILKPWQIEFHPTQEAVAEENRLVILYFENLANPDDPGRLGEVISDLLINDLSQSSFLQLVSYQRLNDILDQVGHSKRETMDRDIASLVADKARAHWMLTGKILQMKPNVVLTAQLVENTTGDLVSSYKIASGPDEDVFTLVDKLTVEIKKDLLLPSAALEEPDAPVADFTTHSPEAYLHYLEGLDYNSKFYFEDAIISFKKALEYDSTFAMVYYYLSALIVTESKNLIDRALEYSGRLNEKEKLYIRSREASIAGNDSLAIDYLHKIVDRFPDEKIALYRLGLYEYRRGHVPESIKLLTQVTEIDPLNKFAFSQLAYAYKKIGDFKMAIRSADRCIELGPDEANPYDTKGEILASNGRLDEAIEYYKKAVSLKRDFLDYSSLMALGRLFIYKGDYSTAHECFQEVAVKGERMARSMARTYMASIPLYQGKLDDALEVIEDALTADEMELATAGRYGARSYKHFVRGYIYLEKGKFELAAAELSEAIRIHNIVFSSDRPSFRCTYAQVLAEGGNFESAEEIKAVLEQEYRDGAVPAQSAYWFAEGSIQYARGDYDKAVESLEKCVAVWHYFEFEIILAKAYVKAGRYSQAVEKYENILADYSPLYRSLLAIEAVKAYYYLGIAYENTGQVKNAIRQYEKFLEIWKDADPGIKEIDDAKNRLNNLREIS